jgi:SAM-dependent methyltransferase
MTIEDLHLLAVRFDNDLKSLKSKLAPADFEWYPYSSMGVFEVLKELLSPEHRNLLRLAGDSMILDAGCGDGDLSFFLESLGCDVFALDCPASNHNGMRGVRALKAARESGISISAVDLDTQFRLPAKRFGLALFLGILYHLKNPYYVLEALAQSANYCLLSTRIAAVAPGGQAIRELPVAYLLGEGEANNDWTNYWIFSEAGLRRLLHRTGWEVLDFISTGPRSISDPIRDDRDERAWCLLRSRRCDPEGSLELLDGWHELEHNSWRWTSRQFSLRYRANSRIERPSLRLEFTMPNEASLEVQASVNGIDLPPQPYAGAGLRVYSAPLPDRVHAAEAWDFAFRLNGVPSPSGADERELGVIVSFDRPPVKVQDLEALK